MAKKRTAKCLEPGSVSAHHTVTRGLLCLGVEAEAVTCGPAPAQKRLRSEACAHSWDGTGAQHIPGSAGLSPRPSLTPSAQWAGLVIAQDTGAEPAKIGHAF